MIIKPGQGSGYFIRKTRPNRFLVYKQGDLGNFSMIKGVPIGLFKRKAVFKTKKAASAYIKKHHNVDVRRPTLN